MSCSEVVLSAVLRSSVVSALGSCAANPRPCLCSFFFNHEVLNYVEDHVFNLISLFFWTAMKCYYSHDPLCICPFAIMYAVMYCIRYLLFCFLRTVTIKHRRCLAFWSRRLAFHCTRLNFLIYTLSRPTGNWLYLYCFLWNFPNNRTHKLCRTSVVQE
jgi:hypothetical protein